MKNRETFSKFVYNLHEHINGMLGKSSGLSYEDVRERYEHFRARCSAKKMKSKIFKYNNKTKKKGRAVVLNRYMVRNQNAS